MGDLYNYRTHGERQIEGVRSRTFSGDNRDWLAPRSSLAPPPVPFSSDKAKKKLGGSASKKKLGGSASSIMKSWNDPEMKRRRRVASYKVYAVEGKVKASLKKGIRWIKVKCSELIHGR